jgi:cytochrome c2
MTDLFQMTTHRVSTGVLTSVMSVLLLAPAACADADAENGAAVFKKRCQVCHAVGDKAKNKVGPALNGIIGRKAGTVEGFRYSKANSQAGEDGWVWTEEVLIDYLANPRKAMPGNKMGYAGLKDEQDRKDVVAYLKTFGGAQKDAAKGAATKVAAQDGKSDDVPPPSQKDEPTKAEAASNTTGTKSASQTAKADTAKPASETAGANDAKAGTTPDADGAKEDVASTTAADTKGEKAASADSRDEVSPDDVIIGGATPSQRPASAPRITSVEKSPEWYQRALTGLEPPYPASFRFLEDQGRWYTPFNRPGMTGPYDIRGWHEAPPQ